MDDALSNEDISLKDLIKNLKVTLKNDILRTAFFTHTGQVLTEHHLIVTHTVTVGRNLPTPVTLRYLFLLFYVCRSKMATMIATLFAYVFTCTLFPSSTRCPRLLTKIMGNLYQRNKIPTLLFLIKTYTVVKMVVCGGHIEIMVISLTPTQLDDR